jgi:hypothetical protein
MRRTALAVLAVLLAACRPPSPDLSPVPGPEPPAQPEVDAPPRLGVGSIAWNREQGIALRAGSGARTLPFRFMRLDVLEVDSAEVRVRCRFCPGEPEGWIAIGDVVHVPARPLEARDDLAEFALAVRTAALHRDVDALRPVMSREFSHQLGPGEPGLIETLSAWAAEEYASLDRVPWLLDRGVAPVPGTTLWAAPPEHATTRGYADLRAGFRRGADGWEWIFLVRDGR